MERQLAIGSQPVVESPSVAIPWRSLLPLWRHAVWVTAVFAVLAVAVAVRLDVQKLRMDLDRNDRMLREADVTHERLVLELDARRRIAAMETLGAQLDMRPDARTVRVTE